MEDHHVSIWTSSKPGGDVGGIAFSVKTIVSKIFLAAARDSLPPAPLVVAMDAPMLKLGSVEEFLFWRSPMGKDLSLESACADAIAELKTPDSLKP